ncbi:Soluble aldose sugar dehydrogenase YliI precursor [Polystyrenella longa]|uniref:Soluble aldose sugar dehydrogenase YliI n=1 Tax=Polystyrenella longa TaxID=2528007 RepID=A0A518CHW3_9PLAN|nr:PQQ-dependent sugar dehydrogenase [Polystyrenella longa]QDU78807.1 Soluble aldose sugar dehydrogenase YliI precursor [Polystyrenella longa]
MRRHRNGIVTILVLFLLTSLPLAVTMAEEPVSDLFQLKERVPLTTSNVIGSPEPPKPYRLKRAYPQLKFDEPVAMVAEPGTNRMIVVQFGGQIVAFEDGTKGTELTEVFNIHTPKLRRDPYNITFHPNYIENRRLYLFVEVRTKQVDNSERIEVYEFKMQEGENAKIDPNSERMIVSWKSRGHTGGGITFGPDGYFYISTGDGTTGSDVNVTGQDITDLQAGILRLDVDNYEEGQAYSIPEDNPFNHIPEARHELWAYGLRAPWRMDWDLPTNTLYIGDVGQDVWEMIHVGKKGANYGWSATEGGLPFIPEREKGPSEITKPIASHHHTESRSITGGYVYRGPDLPELQEAYIYCDYATGKVWGLRYVDGEVTWNEELADSSYSIATFGLDHQNDLFLVDYADGILLQLEPNPYVDHKVDFPKTLSATGLYESVPENKPAAGVVKYETVAPGFHDGAKEELWLAIPGNDWIKESKWNGWDFQNGAVALQTLTLELEPGKQTRVETRLLTRQENEWLGYSYLWNDEQTEATLVEKNGRKVELSEADPLNTGQTRKRTWNIPSRAECMSCHSRQAKFVLSLNSLQLDIEREVDGKLVSQITMFNDLGFFKEPRQATKAERPAPPKVESARIPTLAERSTPRKPTKAEVTKTWDFSLVNPYDESADLHMRARSYLHINCAHCHVKDGGGNAKMELELNKPDRYTNIIGVKPLQGTFDLADGLLIAPGEPSRSVLFYRLSKMGSGHMPQVGSHQVDPQARQFLHDWILTLESDADTPDPSFETISLQQQNKDTIQFLTDSPNAPETEVQAMLESLLSTPTGAMQALHAYEQDQFLPGIDDKMLTVATGGSFAAARDLFERFLPEELRLKRLGTDFDIATLLAQPGNVDRGRELFTRTAGIQCRNCHTVGEDKPALGPDLAKIGEKYTREQILESILEPSKKIEDKYKGYIVGNEDGLVFSGMIVNRGPDGIVVRDNELKDHTVPEDEIDFVEEHKKSLMPEQMFRDLTAEQAADLLEYLSSLK